MDPSHLYESFIQVTYQSHRSKSLHSNVWGYNRVRVRVSDPRRFRRLCNCGNSGVMVGTAFSFDKTDFHSRADGTKAKASAAPSITAAGEVCLLFRSLEQGLV
jgi:hypothetical protein